MSEISKVTPSPIAVPNQLATASAGASMRINNFDLIRLLAAMQVVVSHGANFLGFTVWEPAGRVMSFLPGVPVFFVVSGFLISLSWERAPSVTHYARNRLLRIYPALWVCLGISVVFALASGIRPDSFAGFVGWLAAQATVVQFYNPAFLRGFGVGVLNGSLWTIPVELQFYMILPLLALVAHRKAARWVLLAFAAAFLMLATRTVMGAGESFAHKLLRVSIMPYLFYFLVGVLVRYLYERRPGIFAGRALLWAAIYVVWTVIETHFSLAGAQGNLLNVVSIILIAMLTAGIAFTGRSLSSHLLKENDISYGLYIYHLPVLNLLLANHFSGVSGMVIFLSITAVLAYLSWRLVEKPALSLKDYSLKPRG
jgi:peptidoglycan/LPS O-acetylase OafA/YrhL